MAGIAVIVLASLGLIWDFYWRTPQMAVARVEKMAFPLPDKPSIAVLPFVNLNNDPKEDYISDGLTEQIITSLSSFGRLFVIARNSTFVYKGKPVKVQQVAEDLGVRYVLEGSVQKSGDRLRITAQLIDALKGHHLWSDRYDQEIKNLFELQDEITIKILDAMKLNLTEGWVEYHYKKAKTTNLKAYEKNYQGITHNRRLTKHDNETARRLFEEAIALDPKYYWPNVLLGYTYFNEARNGWSESPAKSIQKAFELAQKAIALDDSNDYGYALLAFLYLVMRQHDKALAAAEKALAVNPNSAWAYFTLASVAGYAGQWEQSILYEKQSMRLNPILDPWDYAMLGRAYFMTSKYDEAIEESKKAIKVNPNYLGAPLLLAAAYSSSGRNVEAAAAAKEVLRINPQFSVETYSKIPPYKNRADLDRELAALRQAGLK